MFTIPAQFLVNDIFIYGLFSISGQWKCNQVLHTSHDIPSPPTCLSHDTQGNFLGSLRISALEVDELRVFFPVMLKCSRYDSRKNTKICIKVQQNLLYVDLRAILCVENIVIVFKYEFNIHFISHINSPHDPKIPPWARPFCCYCLCFCLYYA